MIMVMTFGTFVLAKGITDGIICSWNGMYDPFINKSLQCAIDRDTVKFFSRFFFNIAMRKSTGLLQEKLDDLFPAIGNREVVIP